MDENGVLTIVLYIAAAAVYFLAELITAKGIIRGMDKPEDSATAVTAVCAAITVAGGLILFFGGDVPTASVVCLLLSILLRCNILRWDIKAAAFAAIHMAFYFLCAQSVVTGALSLLFKKNMYQILTALEYFRWTLPIVTGLVLLASWMSYFSKMRGKPGWLDLDSDRWFKNLLIKLLLYLFCLYGSFNLYFNFDIVWFSIQQAVNALISAGIYALMDFYDQRMMERQDDEHQKNHAQKAFSTRAALYDAHCREIGHNMQIRRVLREMSSTVDYLLKESRTEEARESFAGYCGDIKTLVGEERPMSDSKIIGGILYEYANICEQNGIQFQAQIAAPAGIALSEKDFSLLLSCLVDGILYPLIRNGGERPFLYIQCSHKNGWVTVRCDAAPFEESERSVRKNKDILHVKKTVESIGGLFTVGCGRHVSLTVHLPPEKI